MKKQILTILLIFIIYPSISQSSKKSKIDSLINEKEVENFVRSIDYYNYNFDYENFIISNIQKVKTKYNEKYFLCKKIADSLNVTKSFYKADFDKNGLTDILVIGSNYYFSTFVIMDFGNDNLKIYRLTRKIFPEFAVPEIIKKDNKTLINYYYIEHQNWREKIKKEDIIKKTLIYKFGDFIEYNGNPKDYNIEKIEFQTSMCFGKCPVFNIKIDNNKNATFIAQIYNKNRKEKEIQGEFKTIIKEEDYNLIVDLLNYIDFPNLKDDYAVGWTDDQTSFLTITYNNGKVKEIRDYGLIGTFGLDKLYDLFFELRFNQKWKK